MSSDNIKRNNDCGLTILTIAGILGSIAAMIWYSLFADDRRRKKLFGKMKYYQSNSLEEMI
ncbi:MAG: hypothetical protein M3114_05640 [Thermoproteota archaeon]|nr:hypothetical protein [Thermoproteota archaeon]MDQ4067050.1 hypothetical protein [Thermoproteota archaeon]